ncbi:hypothetical protein JHK85_051089 [Glycine max]|nr:hypothetical protein JHK85_051089 [Glycine max]
MADSPEDCSRDPGNGKDMEDSTSSVANGTSSSSASVLELSPIQCLLLPLFTYAAWNFSSSSIQYVLGPLLGEAIMRSNISPVFLILKCESWFSDVVPSILGKGLSKVTTLPADISQDKSESSSSKFKMERSKTERQRHLSPEDAAQIFDDKIPIQEKLKLLNRIATVKDDGTVEFEVPVDVEPEAIFARSKQVNHVVDDSLDATDFHYIPPLNIVMLIVGTRGDVQPFIAIGKRMQDYGHRVRLATHSNFKEFVLTAGLEFYPLGGDPKVLAGYMVKNKGFLPSGPSEIPIQRNQMKEIINSLLPACKEPDIDSGVPFKADAIIANPPAYEAEDTDDLFCAGFMTNEVVRRWPTTEFPHPLSRVKQQAGYRLSYQIVDSLIWLGIRDMINDLRKKKLKLRPVTYLSGSQGSETDVPHAYIWSPHLVPKPKDWGPKIDVVGFCFLDLALNYEPPESLVKWLEEGDKPIYIGFGSLPVQEPKKMTQIIVDALEITGQRGIINKGWGGLGNLAEPKDSIYLLDNCPHDWLFLRCKAVFIEVVTLLDYCGLPAKACWFKYGKNKSYLKKTGPKLTRTTMKNRDKTFERTDPLLECRQHYKQRPGMGPGSANKQGESCFGRRTRSRRRVKRLATDGGAGDEQLMKVHHGGAGTTAAGLKAACPTTIVPFFGDQPFWGERVHARGVGPPPIPVDEFSLPKLVDAIKLMLDPKVKERAIELAKAMENEDGVTGAVKAFFKQLPQKKSESDADPQPTGFFSVRRCFGCS